MEKKEIIPLPKKKKKEIIPLPKKKKKDLINNKRFDKFLIDFESIGLKQCSPKCKNRISVKFIENNRVDAKFTFEDTTLF